MDFRKNERINNSGCRDYTAYLAIQNIRCEERRNLITKLKALANSCGYKIIGRIKLKELEGENVDKK